MKIDRAPSLEPATIGEWVAYDPAWLVDLARERNDLPWLASALSKCRTARWESRAYVAFVDSSNGNAPGSPWQFQECIILEHGSEGDLVLDILVGERVGAWSFFRACDDMTPNPALHPTSQQLRCWLPSSLRSSACLLLALGPARAGCPIDLLKVDGETTAWDGLRVGLPLEDIQKTLGHPMNLAADPEWPGRHSTVLAGDRPIRLTFHEVKGVLTLSSVWIERVDSDDSQCWDRESLVAGLRRAAPSARYLPSRHQPDEPENANEYPMYALDGSHELVLMFKLSAGVIYVGHLSDPD